MLKLIKSEGVGKLTLITAERLKDIFEVKAKFYDAEVYEEKFLMRREARLVRRGSVQTAIDAVVVMINPSNCKPSSELVDAPRSAREWVSSTPNQTQYQLMNMMERKNWNVLTMLNLSDICEGNLKKFCEIEQKFNAAGVAHSIFQDENREKREELLSSADNLIFAWGGSPVAGRLAKGFNLFNNGKPTEKYSHMKAWIHPDKLFPVHPRPALIKSRIAWLDTMEALVSNQKKEGS